MLALEREVRRHVANRLPPLIRSPHARACGEDFREGCTLRMIALWILVIILLLAGLGLAVSVVLRSKAKPQVIHGHFKKIQDQASKHRD
jgi:hypothetical protein